MRKLVFYNLLLIIVLATFSCAQNYHITDVTFKNNPVDENLAPNDQDLIQLYEPYKKDLDKDMAKVIGISGELLEKNKPESGLTNFLADLLLEEGNKFLVGENHKADVSYFNYGGIRTFLPEGEITVRNIYELMPFENEMVFLKLKGSDMKLFLDNIAEGGGDSVGGIRFKIKNGRAENVIIGGTAFNPDSVYWLVTNDYIAGGGDGMEMLKNTVDYVSSGKLIRDVIIEHIEGLFEQGIIISPETDGRISYDE
ncbi:MAG: 5'-nucleotidase C-terminal domain-containing protein [Prolixibacteraceae bacterium]|nr:5'-nucleotidase C-terminal domain-containing protein [Prolixibacteraceae bacterium]